MRYSSPERDQRLADKVTFIGKYCRKCHCLERYISNRQCYECKQKENASRAKTS